MQSSLRGWLSLLEEVKEGSRGDKLGGSHEGAENTWKRRGEVIGFYFERLAVAIKREQAAEGWKKEEQLQVSFSIHPSIEHHAQHSPSSHESFSSNFPFFFLCSQVYVFQASVEPDSSHSPTSALYMITACGSQPPISKAFSSLHQETRFPFAAKSQGQTVIASSKHAWPLFAVSISSQPLT